MSAGTLVSFARRCMYNRWFYLFLALVCALNVISEVLDILDSGQATAIDLISLISGGVAAFLAAVIFLDLQLRRAKL